MRTPANYLFGHIPLMVVALAIVIFAAGCKGIEIQSSWPIEGIAVDGQVADWDELPATFFEDENIVLGIANDNEYVYLQFRTRDEQYARLMKESGLTIYLDHDGGKSKDFSLHLTAGPEVQLPGEMQPRRDRQGAPRDMDRQTEPRFTCFIRNVILEKDIPLTGEQGPAAAFDTSLGFYCWEVSVPLCPRAVRYYGLDMEPGRQLGLGLIWGDTSQMQRPDRMLDDLPDGGLGGRGGGRGRGGPKGGPGMGGGQMPQKQEIWLKTTLATAP
ncbi:MAG: hypothetical protein ABIE70_03360 [bacterium]